MAFDAGFVKAVASELRSRLTDSRVDKVLMPEKEEVVLVLRAQRETLRLSLCCSSNAPKAGVTSETKENPAVPPMFCMLLRKHLTGGRLKEVTQNGFERAIELRFECHNELGYADDRIIIVEIMGKHSNIIFCDGEKKIISAVRMVDFTTSSKRQVLPGMRYDLPPSQNKADPLCETEEGFESKLNEAPPEEEASRFICDSYEGISPLIAREIVYRACGCVDANVRECGNALKNAFFDMVGLIDREEFSPTLVVVDGKYAEYSFTGIKQYGPSSSNEICTSFGALLDLYYVKKDREHRIRQMTHELSKFLSNNERRLEKKLRIFAEETEKSKKDLGAKRYGDAITANIYLLKRGMDKAVLTDYSSGDAEELTVPLDPRLAPSMNAQRYYKKYNKAKTALEMLALQKEKTEKELRYVESVSDMLTRIENESDLENIKHELSVSGYSVKLKEKTKKNAQKQKPMKFETSGGYTVLCGKNNMQNEELTFRTAEKNDHWFHVKNLPGSHVVMLSKGEEPPERDFTEAAVIAATYSKASDGENVPVDYTFVKNIKKPKGSPLWFVTYSTNWTAYVTPDEKLCEKLRKE